jgi:hypothetical protein
MKVRNGFVSNSSSSSFVVINNKDYKYNDKLMNYTAKKDDFIIPDDLNDYNSQFGWEYQMYNRFEDKLCWAILQAQYSEDIIESSEECSEKYKNHFLIFKVLKQHFGYKKIIVKLNREENDYIDHASVGDQNNEIFKDINFLENFLFNSYSYISNGNDNEERDREKPFIEKNPEQISFQNFSVINQLEDITIYKKLRSFSYEIVEQAIKIAKEDPHMPASAIIEKADVTFRKEASLIREKEKINKLDRDELEQYALHLAKEKIYSDGTNCIRK